MGGRGCKVTNKFSNNTHSFPSKRYSKPCAFTLFMKSHLFNIESEKSIIPPPKTSNGIAEFILLCFCLCYGSYSRFFKDGIGLVSGNRDDVQ